MIIFKNDKFLQFSYLIAGIYDLILGFVLLFFDLFNQFFDYMRPIPFLFVQVTGLFLLAIGYYLVISYKNASNVLFIGFGSLIVRIVFYRLVLL